MEAKREAGREGWVGSGGAEQEQEREQKLQRLIDDFLNVSKHDWRGGGPAETAGVFRYRSSVLLCPLLGLLPNGRSRYSRLQSVRLGRLDSETFLSPLRTVLFPTPNRSRLKVHISFQLLCGHFLQSLKGLDLENCHERTGLVAEKCLLSDVIADAVGACFYVCKMHMCARVRPPARFELFAS